jgi:hypothetical protein
MPQTKKRVRLKMRTGNREKGRQEEKTNEQTPSLTFSDSSYALPLISLSEQA